MVIKVSLTKENEGKFNEIEKLLASRGLKSVDRSKIINEALDKLKSNYWDSVASDMTPIEWKFKMAMKDEKMRKDIEKVLSSANFGATKGAE